MALVVNNLTNTQLYVRYPQLPELPSNPSADLNAFYSGLQKWYSDFTRILQRDREDILTLIGTKQDKTS